MSHKIIMKLTTPGRRLAAFAIDQALPIILGSIWLVEVAMLSAASDYYNGYNSYNVYTNNDYVIARAVVLTVICTLMLLAYLVVEIIFFARSQSIGKAILGMKVVRNTDGQPVGIWWMLLRELVVKHASAICFCLGYIWVLIDKKNRAWHDKILDTYVVDIDKTTAPVVTEAPAEPETATEAPESATAEDFVLEETAEEALTATAQVEEALTATDAPEEDQTAETTVETE